MNIIKKTFFENLLPGIFKMNCVVIFVLDLKVGSVGEGKSSEPPGHLKLIHRHGPDLVTATNAAPICLADGFSSVWQIRSSTRAENELGVVNAREIAGSAWLSLFW